jgi:hypothetical protein
MGVVARPQSVGGDEACHADQEHAAPAVQVAEPTAGDQEHRITGGVARNDKLQFRWIGAGRSMDRRHIDDEEVDRGQQAAGQHHDEREPSASVGPDDGRRYGGHDTFLSGGDDAA